jgi:hypothetical protein
MVPWKTLQSYFPTLSLVVHLKLKSDSTYLSLRFDFTVLVHRETTTKHLAEAELCFANCSCDILLHLNNLERTLSRHRTKNAKNCLRLHLQGYIKLESRQARFYWDWSAPLRPRRRLGVVLNRTVEHLRVVGVHYVLSARWVNSLVLNIGVSLEI